MRTQRGAPDVAVLTPLAVVPFAISPAEMPPLTAFYFALSIHAQTPSTRSINVRIYPKTFPPKRRRKATRRAELRIFNALASSNLEPALSYYEWRRTFDDLELDFAVWMRDHGRAAHAGEGRTATSCANGEFELHTQGRGRYPSRHLPSTKPGSPLWICTMTLWTSWRPPTTHSSCRCSASQTCSPTSRSRSSRTVSGCACSGSATNPTNGCRRSCWPNRCGRRCPRRASPVRCTA